MKKNIKVSVLTPTIRVEGLREVFEGLKNQSFRDFEWLTEVNTSGEVDFNEAMNKMIRRAKGELIVFVQDYIKIPPDGLQLFWDAYQKNPQLYTAPVGKTLDGKEISWDWRIYRDTECNWMEWEIDYGAAPLSALKKIGGFDEEIDRLDSWTFGNVNAGFRASLAGFKILNLKDNKAIAIDHNKLVEHPFKDHCEPLFHNYRLDQFRMGLTLDYLSQ